MRHVCILIAVFLINSHKLARRILMHIFKYQFSRCGRSVIFNPFDNFTYSKISIGDSVSISSGAFFSATDSYIIIGNKVMFGPNVSIMCGDHNTSVIGEYMINVDKKNFEDDAPVVIEDDVWVGTGVIILKGVTIGSGSIVAAGSVVTKDIPPYSIAGGIPARVIRSRWSEIEILKHKSILNLNKT